ncbi:MAG: class II aldolase/adducin family protein [Dehalococcoidia bacterium]|nr:transcriptional regulator [Dehalococcoidia bacterium]MDO8636167.1 class II aldolase/adducin family protein [Dehalococcoidia bacterium]
MDTNVDTLKEYLVFASHILSKEGVVTSHGHISARIPGTDKFLIPARRTPGLVRFEDILTFNLANEQLDGEGKPNSETILHTVVYRKRPDVNSVCHIHSLKSLMLSAVGLSLRTLTHHGMFFSDGVPIFHRPVIIVKESFAEDMARTLGQHRAVQLRGHGLVVVGPDVRRACIETLNYEQEAEIMINAMQLGKPEFLTPEELAEQQASSPLGPDWTGEMPVQLRRMWNYYVSRLTPQV